VRQGDAEQRQGNEHERDARDYADGATGTYDRSVRQPAVCVNVQSGDA
jgi:uncharacterized membrane-anchored protein YhcB (DUF1043 family)